MRNEPQLIAYADRLGGDLAGLHSMLDGPLAGAFGGVHVLPFFHPFDGADAGFDPIDHTTVDPRLGTWDDVAALGAEHDLAADLIVNHMSAHSSQFLDWAANGASSPHDGMFLTFASVFPTGASEADLLAIYRPRPGMSFSVKGIAGERRLVWTTFTPEQVDLDVEHPATSRYFDAILDRYEASGVTLVRLDAVGYAVKRPGTSSFMIPETFEFIERLTERCRARGIEVLVEVHGHHRTQIDVASRVDWVYDFALPPLVLDAFFRRTSEGLRRWLALRPANAVTVLDTHDGIGVIDVGRDQSDHRRPGLLTQDQIDAMVQEIHRRSGGSSRAATGEAADNLDLYQVNCTFYDALGRDDACYLAARLIQVLVPGVPQIYYVGALAGTNDAALLDRTGVGRDINRHHYTDVEIAAALERPVVQRLLALLRWRRRSAELFDQATFSVEPGADHELVLAWRGDDSVVATVDLRTGSSAVELTESGSTRTVTDLADLSPPD